MQPYIWGKYMWASIHFISLGYPLSPSDEDKRQYKKFFEDLHQVLPCSLCASNYVDHLIHLPLTNEVLQNRNNLFRWTVDMHNLVNHTLKKRSMSYEDAYQLYSVTHEKKNDSMIKCFSSLYYENYTKTAAFYPLLFINVLMMIIFVMSFKKIFSKRLFGI